MMMMMMNTRFIIYNRFNVHNLQGNLGYLKDSQCPRVFDLGQSQSTDRLAVSLSSEILSTRCHSKCKCAHQDNSATSWISQTIKERREGSFLFTLGRASNASSTGMSRSLNRPALAILYTTRYILLAMRR